MKTRLLFVTILLIITLPFGCADKMDYSNDTTPVSGNKVQDVQVPQSIEVRGALPEECAAGGIVYIFFFDSNGNTFFDSEDSVSKKYSVCNGTKGANGSDGQNATLPGYTPVEAIRACGDTVPYKEVLLRLSNGQVLGAFSNDASGNMTRLAFLSDGNFTNTDNSGCNFSLSTSDDGQTRSISWSGAVQKTWPVYY